MHRDTTGSTKDAKCERVLTNKHNREGVLQAAQGIFNELENAPPNTTMKGAARYLMFWSVHPVLGPCKPLGNGP